MKDDTDSVLEAKSRKIQKISPTPDRFSPPHKEAKRSKSKRKRKKKSADRCDSPEHDEKRARKNSDDPTLVISPRTSSMKKQRVIVGGCMIASIIKPQMSQGKEHHKRGKVVESENVLHPRRHISPSLPYGSWRTPSGG